jgi:ribosome biogenesis protein MAK21
MKPGLWLMVKHAEIHDEEEHFVDRDEEEEEEEEISHHENLLLDKRVDRYDAYKSDPRFALADATCLWELVRKYIVECLELVSLNPFLFMIKTLLATHYAPSVQKFAETLQLGHLVVYQGNPLDDMTLIRFLDRFVYKNFKKTARLQRSKLERPSRSTPSLDILMNSEAFLKKEMDALAPEEVCIIFTFHLKRTTFS